MRILLLAGEESGVLYAERIAKEIRGRNAAVEIRGYGDFGFKVADLAVIGFGPVLMKIFYFLRVKRTMERAIAEWRPDVLCTVDYPGLNLKLAAYAKARGVRTVHVVCPQVWAWKKGRIPKIETVLDKLCCFFPFEPALFRTGLAEFVGHPLVEEMREWGADAERRDPANGVLAVLPGSRMGEIEKHMPTLLEAVERLRRDNPGLKVVIPAANEKAYREIVRQTSRMPFIRIVKGGARDVLMGATAAVVASGTATLEAALAGCPTVLVYRVGWLFACLLRLLVKGVKHVGLANIIAEKAGMPCPMPELLQGDMTAENVVRKLRPWLTDVGANAAARLALADTMRLLRSEGNAISRIADCLVAKGCRDNS